MLFLVLASFLSTCSLSHVLTLFLTNPHDPIPFLMTSHRFSQPHPRSFSLCPPPPSVSPSFFLFPLILPNSCSLSDALSFLLSLSHTQTLSWTLAFFHVSYLFCALTSTTYCARSFLHMVLFFHSLAPLLMKSLCCTLMPFLMLLLPFLRPHGHSFSCLRAHFLAPFLPLSWEVSFSWVLPFYLACTHHFSHARSFSQVVPLFLMLAPFLTPSLSCGLAAAPPPSHPFSWSHPLSHNFIFTASHAHRLTFLDTLSLA